MKKVIRLTESDLVRIVKRVVSEQDITSGQRSPINLGFKKWGDGYLMRIPKESSSPKTDVIRFEVTPNGDSYNVMLAIQGNKRTRSEIKGNTTFKEIERLLGRNFRKLDNVFDIVSGNKVSMDIIEKIYNMISSLKIDDKNNLFYK